jgi:hypothetical protein
VVCVCLICGAVRCGLMIAAGARLVLCEVKGKGILISPPSAIPSAIQPLPSATVPLLSPHLKVVAAAISPKDPVPFPTNPHSTTNHHHQQNSASSLSILIRHIRPDLRLPPPPVSYHLLLLQYKPDISSHLRLHHYHISSFVVTRLAPRIPPPCVQ